LPGSGPLAIFQIVYDEELAWINVDRWAAAVMRASARAAQPFEACGALLGTLPHRAVQVLEAWPVPNRASAAQREYLIAAEDVRRLDAAARARGREIVGFYHSHPEGGSSPSRRDLEQAWPGYVYAIIDGCSADIQYWVLAHDRSVFRSVDAGP
jgi:proteasome lid subunit RPN8/RPN11